MKHFDYKQTDIQLIGLFYDKKNESHYLAVTNKAVN